MICINTVDANEKNVGTSRWAARRWTDEGPPRHQLGNSSRCRDGQERHSECEYDPASL
jgi:hypothetical protein